MSKKINTKHKNFLENLKTIIQKRYIPVNNNYSTQDLQHQALITNEPVQPIIPARRKKYQRRHINNNVSLDTFEKEYLEFISKLKTQKEQEKINEVTNVPETDVETTQTIEKTQIVENKSTETRTTQKMVETV